MSKPIINGIDVSECPLYDKNTGCYHTFNGECVKDSCGVYKWLLEYKCLQEENKRLQMLSCANCGEKYLSPDGAELYDENVRLQEENEELKEKITKFRWDNPYFDLYNNVVGQRDNLERENEELKNRQITKNGFICDCEQNAKYRQALEEISTDILSKYSIDSNKTIIASPLEDLWCIKKMIGKVLNDRN